MDAFQMDWEGGVADTAFFDYEEYISPSSDSSSSAISSRTFGATASNPKPGDIDRATSYNSSFSLTSSNNSSQLSSLVLRRNDSERSGFYADDYDSDSSSSETDDEGEHDFPSHEELESTVKEYLADVKGIENADDLERAISHVHQLSQAEDYVLVERGESAKSTPNHISLAAEAQICTAFLLYSSIPEVEKICEEHFVALACSKGSVMSSGTTESYFDIWLQESPLNSRMVFGWQIHTPLFRLQALRDSLQQHLVLEGKSLDVGGSQSVGSTVRKREQFLGEVLRLPVEVLLKVQSVRGLLRPVEGGND